MQKITPQLRAIGSFAREIELVVDGLVELRDDFARLEPLAVGPQSFGERRPGHHQREIALDGRSDVGT